jgi:hypothetical protein
MEDIKETLKKYYPSLWPPNNNFPTMEEIQKFSNVFHKDQRVNLFFELINKMKDNFYYVHFFSSPSSYFGFRSVIKRDGLVHNIDFYSSILAPYYCYSVKTHKEIIVYETLDASEQVTFLKLGSLVGHTRRLVLFYVDENLMGEIQKFNRLIFDQGRKYNITVEEWKRTKMCRDLYHYAENYRLYESVFYWNNSPPAVAEQISKILELQKEIINFT